MWAWHICFTRYGQNHSIDVCDDISNFADTVARLQKQIDTILKFCSSVKIQINLSKTKIIVFRNGGYLKEIDHWTFNGSPIEVVSFYKYLSVYMTRN